MLEGVYDLPIRKFLLKGLMGLYSWPGAELHTAEEYEGLFNLAHAMLLYAHFLSEIDARCEVVWV